MKKLIRAYLKSCGVCFGMGTREAPNGDTFECPACKGRGVI